MRGRIPKIRDNLQGGDLVRFLGRFLVAGCGTRSTKDAASLLVVGDMDIDILAGKSAGIITCAVTYGIGKREDIIKAKPDFMIDSLAELKNIIE